MKKICLVSFALFSVFMLAGCGNSPEGVVKDCVDAIEKNDMETIKKLCSESVVNPDRYHDMDHYGYKALSGAKEIKAGEIEKTSFSGTTFKHCDVTAIAKNGMKISISVESDGGDYKIVSVSKEYSEKEIADAKKRKEAKEKRQRGAEDKMMKEQAEKIKAEMKKLGIKNEFLNQV